MADCCLSESSGILCIVSLLVWFLDVHILTSTFSYLQPISITKFILYIASERSCDSSCGKFGTMSRIWRGSAHV